MAAMSAQKKWTGSVEHISDVAADKLWALAGDFSSWDKWFPAVTSVELVKGDGKTVGSVRRGGMKTSTGANIVVSEELITFKPEEYLIEYLLLDHSFGWVEYLGTLKIDTDAENGNSIIKWSFSVCPIQNLTEEVTYKTVSLGLHLPAMKALVEVARAL